MSDTQVRSETADKAKGTRTNDLKLEVVSIPVSDVDRAKHFYGALGWRLDADIAGENFRVIQVTPPGSPCSVIFGKGNTVAPYLIVSDIEAARAELAALGAEVSEVYHYAENGERRSGREPARRSYASWVAFKDPDGNDWLLQEVTNRLPGRIDTGETSFSSSRDLAATLRRAAAAHGEHEKRNGGQHDENWPDWYAEYIVREQAGQPLPS
ncbi:VOC family protein [Bosea sp. BK604]|uniref:VOC family protein n=1 Tax=Bosea sp. BK604 TaxID=2512180 RepID=UPI00104C616E|nr:VOC family protein [Bosea sp. BK604]TCR70318.1 putative lactoylglutathione lyase [Bosea sp. BK604]